jgi:hypothetical protein
VLETGKLEIVYPLPRASETDIPIAGSSASWTLTEALFESGACEQHGTTIGGAPGLNSDPCPHCGRKATAKRRKLRKRLDDETADLDFKIECAALYVLCQKSRDELAGALKPHVMAPAMYVPLRKAMLLLDLKMRPPGHRAIV